MPKLTLKNGVTLSYKEIGKGNKILLSTQNFFFTDCHAELLGKPPYDYHVYLIMMRGHLESDHIPESETPDNWAQMYSEDLLAFADAIGAKQFYYTGVSHGCIAGWYIAFHQPERLKAFAATSGVVRFTEPGGRPVGLPDFGSHIAGNREELRKVSWNTFYPTKDPKRLARREACRNEHLEIMMRRTQDEFGIFGSFFKNTRESDAQSEEEYYRQLSEVNVPVLILSGSRDPAFIPEKALKAVSLIPGAQLITYEHLEHAGPDECPEMVARDCDRFFRDIEGRIL
jgi:pimeloyl-ACP methyl ester carboxylesterase